MLKKIIFIGFFSLIKALHLTYRYRFFNLDARRTAEDSNPDRVFIYAAWHQNAVPTTLAHTWQKMCPLCSRSTHGQAVAYTTRRMGLFPVSGSSSRGGKAAREELLDWVNRGYRPAFTVDGPRGPVHKAKPGVVDTARKTGKPIVPVAAVADRAWRLKSWDRMRIPKPFAKITVAYGDPMFVPADTDDAAFEKTLEMVNTRLHELEVACENFASQWATGAPLMRFGTRMFGINSSVSV